MDRTFTLAEAEGLMPALLARTDELVEIRASLVEVQAALADAPDLALQEAEEALGRAELRLSVAAGSHE